MENIKIDYLANHLERVTELASWFYAEWQEYYVGKTVEDIAASIRQRANRDTIPLTLVALWGNALVGTVCLKEFDMEGRTDLSPWLGGLYVETSYRAHGIGGQLLNAIIEQAHSLHISQLYLWTPKAELYYKKRGWAVLERPVYKGDQVSIMTKRL